MPARSKAAKRQAKRGRPKLDVEREPNGRPSRSGIDHEPANRLAIETRKRLFGLSEDDAMDQKSETFIGYLSLIGPRDGISEGQYQGAVQYLAFKARLSRSLKTPGALYDSEATGAGGEITEAYEAWCKETLDEWKVIRAAIQAEQNYCRENLWAALQYVIIEGQRMFHMIVATRIVCNVLARHFKTMQKDREAA